VEKEIAELTNAPARAPHGKLCLAGYFPETFPKSEGREFRLTDVQGRVIRDILS
jgi:hypothetical protein